MLQPMDGDVLPLVNDVFVIFFQNTIHPTLFTRTAHLRTVFITYIWTFFNTFSETL